MSMAKNGFEKLPTEEDSACESQYVPLQSHRKYSTRQLLPFFIVLVCAVFAFASAPWIFFGRETCKNNNNETSDFKYCGSTFEEAASHGCKFDMMLIGWVHPDCYDEELSDKFLVDAPKWKWYTDAKGLNEVPFADVRAGLYPHIFTGAEYHRQHCAYMWQKLVQALIDRRPIDERAYSFHHTRHCSEYMLAPPDAALISSNITYRNWSCGPYHTARGQLPDNGREP